MSSIENIIINSKLKSILSLLLLILISCQNQFKAPQKKYNWKKSLAINPCLKSEYYGDWRNKTIKERFQSASHEELELINGIAFGSKKEKFAAESGKPNENNIVKIEERYGEWPEKLQTFFQNQIANIFVYRNINVNGATFTLMDSSIFSIGVNENVLDMTLSDWLTRKERNFLKVDDPSYEYSVLSSKEKGSALEYVLLHEIAHAFGYFKNLVPKHKLVDDWTDAIPNMLNQFPDVYYLNSVYFKMKDTSFVRLKMLQFFPYNKSNNKKIVNISNMMNLLKLLNRSKFPTFYSARDYGNFFAESMASYVLCIVKQNPYKMQLKKGGKEIITIDNGILLKRCAKTKEYFDAIFKNNN